MLSPTNIEKELQNLKRKSRSEADFANELLASITSDVANENRIATAIKNANGHNSTTAFKIDLLESENIFHIDTIKSICISYRLRFLDTKYFKNDIPEAAIDKIKKLEQLHNTTIDSFKIMAPSKLFRLSNPDDPLLFAEIGNDYYYLIHKWGNDLSPYRKLLVSPLKNLENLLLTTMVFSFLISYVVTSIFVIKDDSFVSKFFLVFLFNFKWMIAVIMFYAIPRGKNVNEAIWDSIYNK